MTNYEPLDWPAYFQSKRKYAIPSEIDPTNIVYTLYESNAGRQHLPVIVLVHGAGHCARSFALVAQALHASTSLNLHARILCPDLRGHGETTSDDQTNLDIDNLAQDLENLLTSLYKDNKDGRYLDRTGKTIGHGPPNIHLIGHSMGGSIVTQVAYRNRVPNISSLFVLDMAESNIHVAPAAIKAWYEARPPVCRTITQAVQWGVESGTVRNVHSARVSFPGMVVHNPYAIIPPPPTTTDTNNIEQTAPTMGGFTWRTDLMASEQHWLSWFRNQNHKFLSSFTTSSSSNTIPKMLIFAEHSKLDKELSSAYLEGRFEFLKLQQAGHAVQEDDPEAVVDAILLCWQRHGICFKPLPSG